jgi:hypothetical protein
VNLMKRFKSLFSVVAALSCVLCAQALPQDQAREKASRQVAEVWLPLLDSRKYAESWEALSPKTKEKIGKELWQAGVMGFRRPLGQLKSRRLGKILYINSLKGYPEHEGAIVRFDSVYENRASVIELVGVIHDEDGAWRVVAYDIPK